MAKTNRTVKSGNWFLLMAKHLSPLICLGVSFWIKKKQLSRHAMPSLLTTFSVVRLFLFPVLKMAFKRRRFTNIIIRQNCSLHLTSYKQQITQNVSNSGINGRLAAWSSHMTTWKGQWLGSKRHSESVSVVVVLVMVAASSSGIFVEE